MLATVDFRYLPPSVAVSTVWLIRKGKLSDLAQSNPTDRSRRDTVVVEQSYVGDDEPFHGD
jgi:hypothetical protein